MQRLENRRPDLLLGKFITKVVLEGILDVQV